MKLWIFNHYAGLPDTVPATRPYDLARHLVRQGHKVTIFACSFNHYTFVEEQLSQRQLVKFQEVDGVQFIWIRGTWYKKNGWYRFFNMLVYSLIAFAVGATLRHKPDVILGTTVHPFAPISAYLVSRLRHVRFWLDITDIWPHSLIELGHIEADSLVAKIFNSLENFSLRKAEVITSVLPNLVGYLNDQGLSEKRTVWTPNGIDFERVDYMTTTKPAVLKQESIFKVMYAGGFAPAHALDVILEAALYIQSKGIDRIQIELIGDGPEMQNVKNFIVERKLENVCLPGFVSKRELYWLLSAADAFLVTGKNLPIYKYGISFNKIFDYLLIGRPILFAVNSLIDPDSDSSAIMHVPGEDSTALAKAIIKLSMTSTEEREQMGQDARSYVRERFDYSIIAQRIIAQF